MKKMFLLLSTLLLSVVSYAQFDSGVDTPGCQAVSMHDERIKTWALGVQVERGFVSGSNQVYASYGKPSNAQGMPDSTTTKAVSLGEGGTALITFDRPIVDGYGADFAVFENAFAPEFMELAFVEVSSDGVNFFRFPAISYIPDENNIMPEFIYNLAGKYEVGYGVPFDLADLPDDALLDKRNIRFVKLVDVVSGESVDSEGNVIYDAYSEGFSTGFDLTAVAILNDGEEYAVSDFEGLLSGTDTHELVSASNGVMDDEGNYHLEYVSGDMVFEALGLYGGMFACGFGPSNHVTDAGYYSSVSLNGLEGDSATYMVGYYSDYIGTQEHNVIRKQDNSSFYPQGVYVNNSSAAYAYLNGSSFPSDGWLTIEAKGFDAEGNQTGISTLYLAQQEEVVSQWTYMDLSSLGECNKLIFSLSTNDNSGYGMNPPAYFCIDAFTYSNGERNNVIPMQAITLGADHITENAARINGEIYLGDEECTQKGFQYKTDQQETWTDATVDGVDLAYYHDMTGLQADMTYIYRAYAVNAEGQYVYGEERSFTTLVQGGVTEVSDFVTRVYPNPVKDVLHVDIKGEGTLRLFDMQGRQVFEKRIAGQSSISLEGFEGIYIMRIDSGGNTCCMKLVVE